KDYGPGRVGPAGGRCRNPVVPERRRDYARIAVQSEVTSGRARSARVQIEPALRKTPHAEARISGGAARVRPPRRKVPGQEEGVNSPAGTLRTCDPGALAVTSARIARCRSGASQARRNRTDRAQPGGRISGREPHLSRGSRGSFG